MTISDKTGEKPVASIRRSKTAAATAQPAPRQEARSESSQAAMAAPVPDQVAARDTYHSPGRVWPD